MNGDERTVFGGTKYAAYHLMLCRWLRAFSAEGEYCYVTLGGTELRDVQNMYFIDTRLLRPAISWEARADRYALALETQHALEAQGVVIDLRHGSIFTYIREAEKPHIFFMDLPGTCAAADYDTQFGRMLQDETIREGDVVFITSYLGRNKGWKKICAGYATEFNILGVATVEEKKRCYRRAHPSFTLFRALSETSLATEIRLRCFGFVEYHDTSTMGIYGYVVEGGQTVFAQFISETPCFDIRRGYIA